MIYDVDLGSVLKSCICLKISVLQSRRSYLLELKPIIGILLRYSSNFVLIDRK